MGSSKQNYKQMYTIIALGTATVGLILIVMSNLINSGFIATSLQNVASALIIAGIFSLVNEYMLKDKLVELVLDKIHLKESIDKTGIVSILYNISDINYKTFIKGSTKKIDIVHVYGRTWTSNNLDDLREKYLSSSFNVEIRVILVSPDSPFIDGLAASYGTTTDELRKTIENMLNIWKELYHLKTNRNHRKSKGSLKLYFHKGFPSHSLYRFDDKLIFVQSRLSKGKTKKLATMVTTKTGKQESLYNTFLDDIDTLVQEAEEVSLNEERG